jgi:hypothetical protein
MGHRGVGGMHRDWRSEKRKVKVWIRRRRLLYELREEGHGQREAGPWQEEEGEGYGQEGEGTGHGQGAKGHGQGGEGNGLVGTEHFPTDAESCSNVVAGGFVHSSELPDFTVLRGEGGILMISVTHIIKNTVNRPGGRASYTVSSWILFLFVSLT